MRSERCKADKTVETGLIQVGSLIPEIMKEPEQQVSVDVLVSECKRGETLIYAIEIRKQIHEQKRGSLPVLTCAHKSRRSDRILLDQVRNKNTRRLHGRLPGSHNALPTPRGLHSWRYPRNRCVSASKDAIRTAAASRELALTVRRTVGRVSEDRFFGFPKEWKEFGCGRQRRNYLDLKVGVQ
jgi:hypothetical protein